MLYFAVHFSLHRSWSAGSHLWRFVNERVETRRAGAHGRRQAGLAGTSSCQPTVRRAIVSSEMGAGPASEEPATLHASLRLAANDRFALPDVRPRHTRA